MPVRKTAVGRANTRKQAEALLRSIVCGEMDAYVGYRQLYGVWSSRNSAVQELRPMFRIPEISPDGQLSVTDEFRQQIIQLAKEALSKLEDERVVS